MVKQKFEKAKTQGWPTTSAKGGDNVTGNIAGTIGPRSATRAVNGGGSLNRGHVTGPGNKGYNHLGGAQYYENGYEGSKTTDLVRKPF